MHQINVQNRSTFNSTDKCQKLFQSLMVGKEFHSKYALLHTIFQKQRELWLSVVGKRKKSIWASNITILIKVSQCFSMFVITTAAFLSLSTRWYKLYCWDYFLVSVARLLAEFSLQCRRGVSEIQWIVWWIKCKLSRTISDSVFFVAFLLLSAAKPQNKIYRSERVAAGWEAKWSFSTSAIDVLSKHLK